MRENPRLLLGAASPRLVVVEPVGGPGEPARRREARIFSLAALVLGLAYLIWLGRLVLASRDRRISFSSRPKACPTFSSVSYATVRGVSGVPT